MLSRRRLAHTTATLALALVGTVMVPSVASASTGHHHASKHSPKGSSWSHVKPGGTSWTQTKPGGTAWTHAKPGGTAWTHVKPGGTAWTVQKPAGTAWT
jgi:hypothetical protein